MHEPLPTAVLLLAYGSPTTLADVEPYYTHIRGGRRPSAAQLADLVARYRAVGGPTPLARLTRAVAAGLAARLEQDAPGRYQVFVAMKHWHPLIAEVIPQIAAAGLRDVLGVALAPHYSRYSLEGYRTYAEQAIAQCGAPLRLRFIEHWHDQPGFRALIAARIQAALAQFPPELRAQTLVLFSAHSLPARIVGMGDPYVEQLRASAAGIATLAGLADHRLCFQSAAPTPEPWLGPDITEYLQELHAEGVYAVLSVPFGFVAEHLEILWDIDSEAQQQAKRLGMTLRRIQMPNADPEFVEVIRAVVRGAD